MNYSIVGNRVFNSTLVISSVQNKQYLECHCAQHFLDKARGLLFHSPLKPCQSLLLMHCSSVHTSWLDFRLDIVYLDQSFNIIKCIHSLKPWRISLCLAARHTLELAEGTIQRYGISSGQQCHVLLNDKTPYVKK